MVQTVGVDLGRTTITTVVLSDQDEVLGEAQLRTPTTGDRTGVIEVIGASIYDALSAADLTMADLGAVGVGAPGVVVDGTVGGASNMPGFLERFSLAQMVTEHLQMPVRVANDGTAGVVAEHRLGAGQGTHDLLCVFVGAGIGAGLILDDEVYEGGRGGAGEFGHMVVWRGGAVCPCGRRGCIEAYAGMRAMELTAQRERAAGRSTVLFDREDGAGGSSRQEPMTSTMLLRAYEQGDGLVADLLDTAIEALGAGIASAVNLLDVDAVVLGGVLGDTFGERFRFRVDAAMRPHLFLHPPRVELIAAGLGSRSAAIGAGILAREVIPS